MVVGHAHQLVRGHGDDGALPQEQGDGADLHRDLDGLAALIAGKVVVPVIPPGAGGQVDLPGPGARLQDVCHQDVAAKQELKALVVDVGVVLEFVHQGAHDGRAGPAGLVLGGVEVGGEAVAQQDGVPDQPGRPAVHPGLGDGVVVAGRVDGEPRLEDAVLHPADEQFFFRGGAVEAADVRALVGLAGQAHAGDDGDVVAQGLPAGKVVAAPGLGVLLDARRAAAADDVGAGFGVVLHHGLGAHLAHQGAHQGLELADGAALAVKVAAGVLVQQAVVLAVVVPDGVGAHVDDGFGEELFPGAAAGGAGVVPESAVAAPPFAHGVGVLLGVLDKDAAGVELVKPGMAQQDAGLDIGHVLGALLVHGGKVGAGVLKAVGVPGKDAALVVVAGVPGGQVEAVDGEAFLLDGVDEVQDGVVAVLFQLGVVHRGALIAQRALGQQGGTAGQQGVVVHHAADGAARDQEQVDVAAVGLPVAVAGPVVALLAAHVEHRLVEVVVKDAHRLAAGAGQPDVEGDVLIKGVHLLGVVAHGVGGALAQELFVLVQHAGLFAKAVKAVLLVHGAVVGHAAVGVQDVGGAGQVAVQQRPVFVVQFEAQGAALGHQADGGRLEGDGLVGDGDFRRHRLDAGALGAEQAVQTVLPGGGGEDVGFFGQLAVKGDPDPDDLVGDKADLDVRAVGVEQERPVQALHGLDFLAKIHEGSPFGGIGMFDASIAHRHRHEKGPRPFAGQDSRGLAGAAGRTAAPCTGGRPATVL